MSTSLTTDLNEVRLRGRLHGEVDSREQATGETVWNFQLKVDRPAEASGRTDLIDCVTASARLARTLSGSPGGVVEVEGRLQRRFWRGATGLNSRYEVAVASGRLRARRRSAA